MGHILLETLQVTRLKQHKFQQYIWDTLFHINFEGNSPSCYPVCLLHHTNKTSWSQHKEHLKFCHPSSYIRSGCNRGWDNNSWDGRIYVKVGKLHSGGFTVKFKFSVKITEYSSFKQHHPVWKKTIPTTSNQSTSTTYPTSRRDPTKIFKRELTIVRSIPDSLQKNWKRESTAQCRFQFLGS